MVNVSILALRNAVLASVADAGRLFSMVNEFLLQSGKEPMFRVQLVGLTREVPLNKGWYILQPDVLVGEVAQTDLVIIPALAGDMMSATYLNKDYVDWIIGQYKGGAEVASLCTGAFLLAFSGLLKGRPCTTHWSYANEFRHFYPSVSLVDEKVITDQNGLYSSGGCNAWWNLLIHLVEKYTDRKMAIRAAKFFVIDLDRSDQSPFIIFNGLKDHDDPVVKGAQDYIEVNYGDKFTVDELADRFHVVRRTFERRFKKATRHTVFEYIQRVKVEAARQRLEVGRKTVSEIMDEVGYTDIQTFRKLFREVTGMTPLDYRRKYNRDVME